MKSSIFCSYKNEVVHAIYGCGVVIIAWNVFSFVSYSLKQFWLYVEFIESVLRSNPKNVVFAFRNTIVCVYCWLVCVDVKFVELFRVNIKIIQSLRFGGNPKFIT